MRPYVRPLIVTFSALGLATLFSCVAVTMTEPKPQQPLKKVAPLMKCGGVEYLHVHFEDTPQGRRMTAPHRPDVLHDHSVGVPERIFICDEGRSWSHVRPDPKELKRIAEAEKAAAEARKSAPSFNW